MDVLTEKEKKKKKKEKGKGLSKYVLYILSLCGFLLFSFRWIGESADTTT